MCTKILCLRPSTHCRTRRLALFIEDERSKSILYSTNPCSSPCVVHFVYFGMPLPFTSGNGWRISDIGNSSLLVHSMAHVNANVNVHHAATHCYLGNEDSRTCVGQSACWRFTCSLWIRYEFCLENVSVTNRARRNPAWASKNANWGHDSSLHPCAECRVWCNIMMPTLLRNGDVRGAP